MTTDSHHIAEFVSKIPFWCDSKQSIRDARTMMDQTQLTHIPVKDGNTICGILNRRDIELLYRTVGSAFSLFETLDLLFGAPLIVDIKSSISSMIHEMNRRSLDATFISENGQVVGYLTLHAALESLLSLTGKGL